jgi:GT2 family glycosyltransferase
LNKENNGFAGGHNQLYQLTNSNKQLTNEYVLLLNQDMYLMPDCIEQLLNFMNIHKNVAVISPRLMKWDFNCLQLTAHDLQGSFTNQIDTLGFKILRNRRVIEKYTGKKWDEIKPKMLLSYRAEQIIGDGVAIEVFGVSGALPILRKEAMDIVKYSNGNIFDESYESYKEDVDLAYRLRSAGFKAYVILDAVCYHDRSAAGVDRKGDLVAILNKKMQSPWVKYHSYKNHLMTIIKNEYWQNYLLDLPFIKWYEFKKFCYFLIFDRQDE